MKGERVKVSESQTLARKRGSEREHEEERVGSTVKAGSKEEGRASIKSLPRRSRRKHERVSGYKSSPGQSAES